VRGCAADLSLVCVALPTLLYAFFVISIVTPRDSKIVEIPRKREKDYKEESRGIQVDHWIA
jgi:hypothetical protein